MLRFAISSASSNFFSEIGIFPFDWWRKPLCVKGRQNYPARSPRWLARKIIFWPISGTDFDTSGTRLVRKSAQGLFSPWNKLSRQKCRSPESISSSRLVAPGSPRMIFNQKWWKIRFLTLYTSSTYTWVNTVWGKRILLTLDWPRMFVSDKLKPKLCNAV